MLLNSEKPTATIGDSINEFLPPYTLLASGLNHPIGCPRLPAEDAFVFFLVLVQVGLDFSGLSARCTLSSCCTKRVSTIDEFFLHYSKCLKMPIIDLTVFANTDF